MSEILNGNASNVSTPLSQTVTALANNGSGEIRVTTSAPHLFGPNDNVLMATGVASGSGYFPIAIVDPTHFDLVGSTYVSTSTGTATDLSLTPQVQVPTDGDTFSMQLSGMLSSLQALLDRSQWLSSKVSYELIESFTASGSWVCPPGCFFVALVGCGGGGGGEGGCSGLTSTNTFAAQGGGGAGAPVGTTVVAVVPGVSYAITIGGGGAGGRAGNAGAGADGESTSFIGGAVTVVAFLGGRGAGIGLDVVAAGYGALNVGNTGSGAACVMIAPGAYGVGDGTPRDWPWIDPAFLVMNKYPNSTSATTFDVQRYVNTVPGAGGAAIASHGIGNTYVNFPGGASTSGVAMSSIFGVYVGGSPGNIAANGGSYLGGVGGGGGGGGAFGWGGNGGAGGNGSSGTGANGSAGSNASANTGAGGGGGGCGGGGSTGGTGGAGGNGGTGLLNLYWVRSVQ